MKPLFDSRFDDFSRTEGASSRSEEQRRLERLSRIFNTELVELLSSHGELNSDRVDFTNEIFATLERPAFKHLMRAIAEFARDEQLTEAQATQEMLKMVSRLERLWSAYLIREGTQSLKRKPKF